MQHDPHFGRKDLERREGLAKLTGSEPYVDDLPLDGALWVQTVRSPAPRGRIRAIRFPEDRGVDWSQCHVVDHRDLPGPNVVKLIEDDQPILAVDRVCHVHEPILLVAHPSREMSRRAARAVEIEIDEEAPSVDFRRDPAPEAIHAQYVFKHITIQKGGDIDAALAAAPHVIEGVYETGAQEHVYLETQGMAARLDADGVLVVQGSMQCPYYVLAALTHALGRGPDEIRVVQTATGGGFGGKEEFPSVLALHAALVTLKTGRPARLIYDRGEDMAVSTKRHPSWVRHVTGVDDDGRLLAQKIEVRLDAGAYATLSAVVLSRAVLHAAGPYACEHVEIDGKAVRTHTVPSGAFRGFGAPQTHFANERHMDVIAARLGIDPAELRRRNLLRDGESTATGQVIEDGADRHAILERALEMARWTEKRAAHQEFNRAHAFLRRGLGLATFHHGAGFTGSGESYLASIVEVEAHADGRVEVLAASTEMGQGTTTIFTQIAAARLGYDPRKIVVAQPDTARVPNSGPTVASRTVMIVGRLVERACDDLRARLGLTGAVGEELEAAIVRRHRERPGESLRGRAQYEAPPGIVWDDQTYRGAAYPTFGWATYIAEVEVDLRTYVARVVDFVAVQDVGTVVNATLARGQVQGGVVQAIGWALLEEVRVDGRGAMRNPQLTNYIIPTSDDVPPIRVDFLETPYAHGALGAKGLGELPMDGPAPAIVNAVADAVGVRPWRIPLTPEHLMELMEERDG